MMSTFPLPPQKPSVGRIVIFVFNDRGESCPAVITRIWSDTCVNLHLMRDDGQKKLATDGVYRITHDAREQLLFDNTPTSVNFEQQGNKARTWHWPPRV